MLARIKQHVAAPSIFKRIRPARSLRRSLIRGCLLQVVDWCGELDAVAHRDAARFFSMNRHALLPSWIIGQL
jgi:hypothetical protein